MVRALDLKSGGSGFKSSSLSLGGFVVVQDSTPPGFVNSQLVSLPQFAICNKFLFNYNLQYSLAYFSVLN